MSKPDTATDATEVPDEPQLNGPADTADSSDDTPPTTDDQHPDDADEDDAGDVAKARAQAAKYRARLRETETERDQLREQLAAQHRALIDWRSTTADRGSVDPALLDAAGLNIEELLDDNGHLDMGKVDEFIDSTATRFKVHRQVKPNPQQGTPSLAPGNSLAAAFSRQRHP